MTGLAVGGTRLIMDLSYPKPACGEEEKRPAVLYKVHFLHFAIILSVIVFIVCAVVSLLTKPLPEEKVIIIVFINIVIKYRELSRYCLIFKNVSCSFFFIPFSHSINDYSYGLVMIVTNNMKWLQVCY